MEYFLPNISSVFSSKIHQNRFLIAIEYSAITKLYLPGGQLLNFKITCSVNSIKNDSEYILHINMHIPKTVYLG